MRAGSLKKGSKTGEPGFDISAVSRRREENNEEEGLEVQFLS